MIQDFFLGPGPFWSEVSIFEGPGRARAGPNLFFFN